MILTLPSSLKGGGLPGVSVSGMTFINAKTYAGAAFDNVTDDTTKVQAAANASAGGMLFFPEGICRTAQINIPIDTFVIGTGAASILKPITLPSASRYDSVFDVANNVTIANLKIDGNGTVNIPDNWADAYNNNTSVAGNNYRNAAGRGRGYRCGIRAEGVTGLTVTGVEITNCAGAGIGVNDSSQIVVVNNNFHDLFWEAMYEFAGTSPLLELQGGTNVIFAGNIVNNVHAPAAANAMGTNPNGVVIRAMTEFCFADNTISNTDRNSVKLEGCQDGIVSGNTFSAGNPAIDFPALSLQPLFGHHERGPKNTRITGNHITGPGFQSAIQINSSSVTVGTADNIEVDNNTVVTAANLEYGVLADGDVGLKNISIHDNTFGTVIWNAIRIAGGGTTLSIQNNQHNGNPMPNVTAATFAKDDYDLN